MKILIIRLSAIGDIVMASGLVAALKQRYPDAEISWLVEPESRELLSAHPDLQEVIVWDRKGWQALKKQKGLVALLKTVSSFRKELKQREFDLVLDCQGLLKSGVMAWFTGANQRIGLGSREGSQILMTRVIERGGDNEHIGSEYRYLAQMLGFDYPAFAMQIATNAEANAKAKALVAASQRYAVICPFTTRPQKHWFDDAWVALGEGLHARGYAVVMLGGPGDFDHGKQIADKVELLNLVGKTDLQTATAIIRDADFLVGVDTGLTHIGVANEIPLVGLFGSTKPYLRTASKKARIIYHNLECAPCKRRPVCNGAFTCMRGITAAEVLQVEQRLVGGGV